MAHNVNVTISSENDGTTRNNVSDYLVHLSAEWIDDAGVPQSFTQDEYLLLTLNWLLQNHPQIFRTKMQRLVLEIARLRYGVDSVREAS